MSGQPNARIANPFEHREPAKPTTLPSSANATATSGVDLSQSVNRAMLAAKIKTAIDDYCAVAYDDGHRTHLGASLIGRECSRYLWYVFRWVYRKKHTGQQQRLLNRGHLEEARFIEWFRAIGGTVSDVDMDAPLNDKLEHPQHRISACHGHFGGSLDAMLTLPENFGGMPIAFINEYKTHNTKSFSKLVNDGGVKVTKYEHFCQMSMYGRKKGYHYGCYAAINKNDDDIYIEIVELDWALAERLELKAEKIIFSPTPPPKLSEAITFTACTYCDMREVCHKGQEYEKNCRSCIHAVPAQDKQWGCKKWNALIPKEAIPQGCPEWSAAR